VVGVFVLIVLTTYWPGRKSRIERHGRIPLEDDR
jgi:cbb3-type cytochrome oxidase subunit 3